MKVLIALLCLLTSSGFKPASALPNTAGLTASSQASNLEPDPLKYLDASFPHTVHIKRAGHLVEC